MLSKKALNKGVHASTYSYRYFEEEVPKSEIPENSMPAVSWKNKRKAKYPSLRKKKGVTIQFVDRIPLPTEC